MFSENVNVLFSSYIYRYRFLCYLFKLFNNA